MEWTNLIQFGECCLQYCYDIKEFPYAPKLEELTLLEGSIQTIPSLPSLLKLTLHLKKQCPQVAFCPKLRKVVVNFYHSTCQPENPNAFSFFYHVETFALINCTRVHSLKGLESVKNLLIRNCDEIPSLDEISGSSDILEDTIQRQRKVQLIAVGLRDSGCRNICCLTLQYVKNLPDLNGITNIHQIIIKSCSELRSTKGIGRITGSLTIDSCWSLYRLENLQNIPEVNILKCSEIFSFDGLGNHDILRMDENNSKFQSMLHAYRVYQTNSPLFGTIGILYVA
jgi:hypothetical protein